MADAFVSSIVAGELRQGEILSGLSRYDYDSSTATATEIGIPFCITLNQDCDLKQDFDARATGRDPALEMLLFAEARLADEVRPTAGGKDLWKRIAQNENIRFQLFSAILPAFDLQGQGIGSLVVDFRSVFSMPVEEVNRQLENGAQRRSSLIDQYREHFQSRFASYIARIMLPEPHEYVAN